MEAQKTVSNSTQCGLLIGEYKKYTVSGVTFSFKSLLHRICKGTILDRTTIETNTICTVMYFSISPHGNTHKLKEMFSPPSPPPHPSPEPMLF